MREVVGRLCRELEQWVAGVRPEALTPGDAAELLAVVVKVKHLAVGAELLLVGRASEAPMFRAGGLRPVDHLARTTGTSTRDAQRALDTSRALADLPVIDDAIRTGELSQAQLTEIAGAASVAPAEQSRLIATAKREDLTGLRTACARTRAAADPDPERRHARVRANRHLRTWTDRVDGARCGHWSLPVEDAAEVEAVLEGFCEARFRHARAQGHREHLDAYRADALVAMARAAAATPTPTGTGTGRGRGVAKTVVVRVDREVLLRGHTHHGEVCEIRGLGPVPPSVARHILDDAFLKALFHDGTDVRLVNHLGRHIPAELRTALEDRDQVCTDPGCNRHHRLQFDHTQPVALGGPTSQANLQAKCIPGHQAKTRQDLHTIRTTRTVTTDPDPPPHIGPFDNEGLHL